VEVLDAVVTGSRMHRAGVRCSSKAYRNRLAYPLLPCRMHGPHRHFSLSLDNRQQHTLTTQPAQDPLRAAASSWYGVYGCSDCALPATGTRLDDIRLGRSDVTGASKPLGPLGLGCYTSVLRSGYHRRLEDEMIIWS